MRSEKGFRNPSPDVALKLLRAALNASGSGLAELLDSYRPLLLAMAEALVDSDLRPKVSPSDLVQETLIEATDDFSRASFESDRQVEAWLKTMLLHNLADARKRYRQAAKRDIRRERSVHDSRVQKLLDQVIERGFRHATRTDHRQATRDRLAQALKRLPSEQRAIIVWVHIKGISLNDIARRANKSYDATRMFWKRALMRLRRELENDHETPAATD